jgi:predicted DNA-binding transcriptional regulator AlpA
MDSLLNIDDVAERLRLSRRSVWKLVAVGKLPKPVKVLAASRWKKTDIDVFITGLCGSAEAADKTLSQE